VLESSPRFRLVGFRIGLHGRTIGRRRRASLAVAPIATATAAATPSAAPVAVAAPLGTGRVVIPTVVATLDMGGFGWGTVLDALSLAFALNHDRRGGLLFFSLALGNFLFGRKFSP